METISTYLFVSLHHPFPVLSSCFQSCQLSVHIFSYLPGWRSLPGVVNAPPSRRLNCSLPRYNHVHHPLVSMPIVLFPGTTMFIILFCPSQLFSSPVQPCSSSSCVHTNCSLPRYNHVHHPLVYMPIVLFPGTTMFIIILCLCQLFSSPVQQCSSSSCVHPNCSLPRYNHVHHPLVSIPIVLFPGTTMFIIHLCPYQLFSSPVQPCSSSSCVHTNCSLPRYNHVNHPLVSIPIVLFPGTTMFIILLCPYQL